MRRANLSYVAILAFAALSHVAAVPKVMAMPQAGATKEFFVDEEIDYIRDAQGLPARVSALLKLANIRLVTLGMKEKSKDDRDLEKKIANIHDEMSGKTPAKDPTRPTVKPPLIPIPIPLPGRKPKPDPSDTAAGPYLTDLTRIEVLRGYIEALDEIQSDIDDAYREKLEVRGELEQFEKFLSTSVPLLRKFQAGNAGELQAIGAARSATQEALDAAQDALKKIPKTERSTKP